VTDPINFQVINYIGTSNIPKIFAQGR